MTWQTCWDNGSAFVYCFDDSLVDMQFSPARFKKIPHDFHKPISTLEKLSSR